MRIKMKSRIRLGIPLTIIFIVIIPFGYRYTFNQIIIEDGSIWINFIGSYIGAAISGILTLIGVLLTIEVTQKQLEEEISAYGEEKRLSILPYINPEIRTVDRYCDHSLDDPEWILHIVDDDDDIYIDDEIDVLELSRVS